MFYSVKYDPKRDLKAVSQTGALDLKEAFANNAVPATLNASEGKFNDIDDPASIGTRVKDTIDAEVLSRTIGNYKAPVENQ